MAAALTLCACNHAPVNPFLTEWDTPYGIPPFDRIAVSDYLPAIHAGIEEEDANIAAIVANPEAPTFDNTIAALELAGPTLAKVSGVLYNVFETDRSDELDAVVEEATALLTAHSNNISFNKGLYERIAALWNADQSQLTREQQLVLKKYYDSFERSGIGLSEEKQARLKELSIEEAAKSQKLSNNILAESNAFKAEFGFSVSEYPVQMTVTEDRDLRERMFKAYSSRGHNGNDNDNRQLALDVMKIRIEEAQIKGYDCPARFILEPNMAHDPETVDAFLAGIMKASVSKAKAEIADMQKVMNRDIKAGKLPKGTRIQPWDWWYYAEQVRKEKYDLDEEQTKPYFKLENVVNGIFTAANRLYGITMEKLEGVPSYNPDCVTTYKVLAADGSLVGIFTTDYHPRDSKRGGAWMNNVRNQYYDAEGNNVRPIIVNVGNLPEYLSIDDVQTVFHEFGHALHGLLTQCHFASISGTSVTHDFVETFSQINENWAFQPDLLAVYARHSETGEVIPDALVEKILNSLKFNQGFMTTELCAASILDMKWHELTSIEGIDVDAFEEKVCREMGLIDEIIPRYRTTYFNHIFSSGYQAGYYGYLWAEVIDKDLFSIFEASGSVWNQELASQFKQTFLEKGGSEEAMVLFKSFAHRDPDNTAFLKGRGLID